MHSRSLLPIFLFAMGSFLFACSGNSNDGMDAGSGQAGDSISSEQRNSSGAVRSRDEIEPDKSVAERSRSYDSLLAAQLGADDYGMRQYVMAFLKRGPIRDLDSAKAMELQMKHLENIGRMAEEGSLVLAGPFMDDGDIRGIYIFDVRSVTEAGELTKTDPAIQAGSLVMELHPWYGSAAVMKINEIHNQVAKINF